MDVKNHNTNRKKRVVRKRWNAAVLIALFVGIEPSFMLSTAVLTSA